MKVVLVTALVCTVLTVPVSGDTTAERLTAATEAGELSLDQMALYLVQSVLDPGALPAVYTEGADTEKCGTVAIHQAELLLDVVSAPVRGQILDLLPRPTLSGPEYTFNSPGDFFKMHWTDTGADATNLSYVQNMASYFDYSLQEECGTLGYFEPPPDNMVGGDNRYDIYVQNLSGGVLGYCSCGGEFKPPDSSHAASASYIALDNSLGANLCKVTAAHELQHAIQMAYDYMEPPWFMENCAVWIEDMVYDDINDYISYLLSGENPLRRPWYDIRSNGMYFYGASIYPRYMWLRLGVDSVREVWENCAATIGSNMLSAQQDMFTAHGMTWEEAFMEYACWRWFVKTKWFAGCGMFDEEAELWGQSYVFSYHNHSTLPASGDEGIYAPETYGIVWVQVDLENYQDGWIEMAFDGRDYFEWNLGAIMWLESGDFQYSWYDCDPTTGDFTVEVQGAGWDYAVFVIAFMSESSLSHTYSYDLSYQTGIGEGAETSGVMGIRAGNPLSAGGTVHIDIPAASHTRLDVFDLSGRMVSTLFEGELAEGTHGIGYDGGLSRGTYFLRLFSENGIVSSKVVVTE